MKKQTDPDVVLMLAAAEPTRLSILRELTAADGPINACDFSACSEVSQPTFSHHLKVLKEAGWLRCERVGNGLEYDLRPEARARFKELAEQLT